MKIAIYGPMCSGKTTVASIIQDYDTRYSIYSFGKKIKDLAIELFQMEGKNRSLLINIADKMREIDEDVWAKYIIQQYGYIDNFYRFLLVKYISDRFIWLVAIVFEKFI